MDNRIVPPYHLVQLGRLQEDFNSEASKFFHIMTNGGGLKNMKMNEVIERLHLLYLQVSAHLDAARDVGGQISLESGTRALAIARAMASEDDSNDSDPT